jgi:periplasmic divalent cation tolerance protein
MTGAGSEVGQGLGDDICMVWTTFPERGIAEEWLMPLVQRGIVACGNLFSGMRSVYRWQGSVEVAEECGLLMKTTGARLNELRAALRTHPYEVPAFVVWKVDDGAPSYLEWVRAETR